MAFWRVRRERGFGSLVDRLCLSSFFDVRGNPSSFLRQWITLDQHNMERTRQADRSQLIRFSAVAFAVLAITSFLLARIPW